MAYMKVCLWNSRPCLDNGFVRDLNKARENDAELKLKFSLRTCFFLSKAFSSCPFLLVVVQI